MSPTKKKKVEEKNWWQTKTAKACIIGIILSAGKIAGHFYPPVEPILFDLQMATLFAVGLFLRIGISKAEIAGGTE